MDLSKYEKIYMYKKGPYEKVPPELLPVPYWLGILSIEVQIQNTNLMGHIYKIWLQ